MEKISEYNEKKVYDAGWRREDNKFYREMFSHHREVYTEPYYPKRRAWLNSISWYNGEPEESHFVYYSKRPTIGIFSSDEINEFGMTFVDSPINDSHTAIFTKKPITIDVFVSRELIAISDSALANLYYELWKTNYPNNKVIELSRYHDLTNQNHKELQGWLLAVIRKSPKGGKLYQVQFWSKFGDAGNEGGTVDTDIDAIQRAIFRGFPYLLPLREDFGGGYLLKLIKADWIHFQLPKTMVKINKINKQYNNKHYNKLEIFESIIMDSVYKLNEE